MNLNSNNNKWWFVILIILLAGILFACGPANVVEEAEATPFVTTSGLEYIEIEAGTGEAPQAGDLVAVHYSGTLENGTQFDSSEGGAPIQFTLGRGQVIAGWDEGIALMRQGGKARLIIPPELGYGVVARPNIPSNSTLIFEVELVSISPPPTPPTAISSPTVIDENNYQVTESGLKYHILQESDGDTPEIGEVVTIGFAGWLENGFLIGDSQATGPLQFIVGEEQILAGWDEAVQLMKVGEKAQFVIPPELALGEQGTGDGFIPANATLIFELELLGISPPPPTPTPAPPPVTVAEEDYSVTDSGIRYFVIEAGDGPQVADGDTVVTHYTLWLEDGTRIDSSRDRGQPFPVIIGVGQVIPGWEEGLQLMHEGETMQLVIPPELGYGDTGVQGIIPPGTTLIFELEVVAIQSVDE